jgi:hypothetical protein
MKFDEDDAMRKWLWILLMVFTSGAHADWYESTGWAPIINSDEDRARARAVENAIRQSLDFAGGTVTSVEKVVDGVLTGHYFEWNTTGAIEHAELVRERRNGERIEVTVRANIRQTHDQCAAANFRKGVAVVPFELAQPAQARYGDLWALDRAAAEQFAKLLGQHGKNLFPEHRMDRKVGFTQLRDANNERSMAEFARNVAAQTDAQYVVAGIFDDISTEKRNQRQLATWRQPPRDRNFSLTLYLFDGASGELKTRANVRDKTAWDFQHHAAVDPRSSAFWSSGYGQTLQKSMQDLVFGFNDKLRCEEPRGHVVRAQGDTISVNLGSKHGIENGQTLHVYHRGNFYDNNGIYREQWVLSPYQLEIAQVQQSSASARVVDDELGSNIQVNDRVVVR